MKKGQKPEIQKMDGRSKDNREELRAMLAQQCPEAFAEGKVDLDRLRQTLGEAVAVEKERYGLSWAGKSDCYRHIQETTTATLRPVRDQSVEFDTTGNLFIEGDNLQVLKVLQKSYYGRIKMIYIDPPYNTGNDSFIYPDRFAETQDEYLKRIGDKDSEGNLIRDGFWRKNSRDAGHFHSNWLSMMYPRLFLARNLLRPDGVIFVSIDDNEVHNLRMIMNEVFGEENFISQIIWKKSYGGGSKAKHVVSHHEYILIYAKVKDSIPSIDLPPDPSARKYYSEKDDKFEKRGPFRTQPLATTSMDERPNLRYAIVFQGQEIWPEKQWQWARERVNKALENNDLVVTKEKGKWSVYYKQYLYDEDGVEREAKPYSILDGPYTQIGTAEVTELFEDPKIFSFPKPTGLIKHFLQYFYKDKDSIILDFFAGSCTTAHAVMAINADGGNRRFICVQMAEPCEPDSEAYKAGYKTIADIGRERIRRAAKKIAGENKGKLDFDGGTLDLGFKAFRLEESNFKEWRGDAKTAAELETQLSLFVENLKPGANSEDILYELILKSGLDLHVAVEAKKVKGKGYYRLDGGKLIVCLEEKITQGLVDAMLAERPEKVVCLDRAFAGNDQLKTNTALQMDEGKVELKVI